MKEALKQEKEMAKLNKKDGEGIKDVLKYGAKKALTLANRVTKILPSCDKNARNGWDDDTHGILLLPDYPSFRCFVASVSCPMELGET